MCGGGGGGEVVANLILLGEGGVADPHYVPWCHALPFSFSYHLLLFLLLFQTNIEKRLLHSSI